MLIFWISAKIKLGHGLVVINHGIYVFAQLFESLPKYEFDKCVSRDDVNLRFKIFTCLIQFLTMSFGQLNGHSSLRDLVSCLAVHRKKLNNIGTNYFVNRSTLAEANENRSWQTDVDLAQVWLAKARTQHLADDFGLRISSAVYALDAATIDLCLNVFWRARFRKAKAAVKLHRLLDLRGNLPALIQISDGKMHDVNILGELVFEPLAIYLMDKGYLEFRRLYLINQASAFVVTQAKTNLVFNRIGSRNVDEELGFRCDQNIRLTIYSLETAYSKTPRRKRFYDKEQ